MKTTISSTVVAIVTQVGVPATIASGSALAQRPAVGLSWRAQTALGARPPDPKEGDHDALAIASDFT